MAVPYEAPDTAQGKAYGLKVGLTIGGLAIVFGLLGFFYYWFFVRKRGPKIQHPAQQGTTTRTIVFQNRGDKVRNFIKSRRGIARGKPPFYPSASHNNDIEMGHMNPLNQGEPTPKPSSLANISTFVHKIAPGTKPFNESEKRRSTPLVVNYPSQSSTSRSGMERRGTAGDTGLEIGIRPSEDGWEEVYLGDPVTTGNGRQAAPAVPDRGRKPTRSGTHDPQRKPDYTTGW